MALAFLCADWWFNMVSWIVLNPIPLDRPALKDIESCCAKKPQDDIDHVSPPENAQPFLVDQKQAAVEKKQSELDEGKGRSYEHHTQPDMLR